VDGLWLRLPVAPACGVVGGQAVLLGGPDTSFCATVHHEISFLLAVRRPRGVCKPWVELPLTVETSRTEVDVEFNML
jgi:hypothetical protein